MVYDIDKDTMIKNADREAHKLLYGSKIVGVRYMTKEEAENFIYKCLVDNESKKDPKEKLTRLDICDILHTDFEIPKSTAYRYYKDSFNLYKWEQAKPDPSKKLGLEIGLRA